jgi:cytochrome c oxidase accessory protein FixG
MTHLPIFETQELPSAALPADGRRRAIQPADVRGRYHRARRVVFACLIALWAVLPWITVGGHPALFADVAGRRLFLFGMTFNAQDTWLLFFLLTGIGFGLFYATALAGRVWCGWSCPQTVFLEGVFRPIERWIEGPRERRLRRNAGPWSLDKAVRKVAVHLLYALAALGIAHIFLSYFVSLPAALRMVRGSPGAHPEAFAWVVGMTAVFYVNFAWFREQLCVVICPYGRLQSAMVDGQTLTVGYDARRGEPRGKRGAAGAGDCVDCRRCVVVCPTGIDIRNGTQMECLACTACIDACDEVMDKLGRARGLVRYDSLEGLAGRPRVIVRPRIVAYTALMLVGALVAFLATRTRTDFEATILRLPGAPYSVEDGQLRNALQIHLVNKRASARSYRVEVDAAPAMTAIVPLPTVSVESMGSVRVPVFLSVPREAFNGDFPIHVRVVADGDTSGDPTKEKTLTALFLGPSR